MLAGGAFSHEKTEDGRADNGAGFSLCRAIDISLEKAI